jgi:hypothetical protein
MSRNHAPKVDQAVSGAEGAGIFQDLGNNKPDIGTLPCDGDLSFIISSPITPIPMKSYKLLLVVAALVSASFAFAEEAKKDPAAEPHKGKCCLKAEKDGNACTHECCVAAAKEGKNCEKCGGTNAAPEAKK